MQKYVCVNIGLVRWNLRSSVVRVHTMDVSGDSAKRDQAKSTPSTDHNRNKAGNLRA